MVWTVPPEGRAGSGGEKLNDALGKALENPAVQAKLRETGVTAGRARSPLAGLSRPSSSPAK